MNNNNNYFLNENILMQEVLQVCTNIIGARDEYTQGHSHHVYIITKAILEIGNLPLDLFKVGNAALLHGIGKIMIPRSILKKEGALTSEEWELIRRHPEYGKQMLQDTYFEELSEWILYHHERIDGKGYYGLNKDEIPLASKVIAVADTFSALRTYRSYRPALSVKDTIGILKESAGTQLDEEIVNILLGQGKVFLEELQCNCPICVKQRALTA